MKIAFICAGDIQIPPPSWGAVEILVWEYYNNLINLGIDVQIYNTKDLNLVNKEINEQNFDFIHLQHEDYLPYIKIPNNKKFAVTAHCGWAENYVNYDPYYWKTFKSIIMSQHYIFSLSEQIKQNYINFGANPNNIYVTKNGVNVDLYNKSKLPRFAERSLFLGKIDSRKRQHSISNMNLNIDFAGFGEELKLSHNNRYVGEWSKQNVYSKTTEYANLILISKSEAHPLVCMEALASGLGLVLTEKCTANLDLDKKFISVVTEQQLQDERELKKVIENNRNYSINNREEILEYSKKFDWKQITIEYKNLIEKLIYGWY